MKRKTSIYTTAITMGTVLTSLPVFAHSGHVEENSDTTEAPSTQQNSTSSSSSSSHMENKPEEASSQSTSTQQNATSSSPSSNTNQSSTENNHDEETQAVEAQPTTQAQVLTIGKVPALGEAIFGLIIATPFLLYAARKRIHQS